MSNDEGVQNWYRLGHRRDAADIGAAVADLTVAGLLRRRRPLDAIAEADALGRAVRATEVSIGIETSRRRSRRGNDARNTSVPTVAHSAPDRRRRPNRRGAAPSTTRPAVRLARRSSGSPLLAAGRGSIGAAPAAATTTATQRRRRGAAPSGATKLTIGYSAWPGWFPLAVAEEKGIFEKAGLDVDLKYFADYTASLDALVAGQVDVNAQTLNDTIFAVAVGRRAEDRRRQRQLDRQRRRSSATSRSRRSRT